MSNLPELATDLKGIAAEMAACHPHLRRHIERAVALLERKGLWLDATCPLNESAYIARSSDGTREYQVLAGHCSCEAGLRGRLCYHRVARRLREISCERLRAELFAGWADAEAQHQLPPTQPIPGATRWRWQAGKIQPRSIRADQRAMGEHLQREATRRPSDSTLH
jgi:hypothetical protein